MHSDNKRIEGAFELIDEIKRMTRKTEQKKGLVGEIETKDERDITDTDLIRSKEPLTLITL